MENSFWKCVGTVRSSVITNVTMCLVSDNVFDKMIGAWQRFPREDTEKGYGGLRQWWMHTFSLRDPNKCLHTHQQQSLIAPIDVIIRIQPWFKHSVGILRFCAKNVYIEAPGRSYQTNCFPCSVWTLLPPSFILLPPCACVLRPLWDHSSIYCNLFQCLIDFSALPTFKKFNPFAFSSNLY